MKKLISLAKTLSNLGLKRDSKLVYLLLKSASPPMEASVSMHPHEPVNLYGDEDEEDEEGNPIKREERKWEKMRRERIIQRSKRRTFNSQAEEDSEMNAWYKSLSNLGDSVILIPFNRTEVEKNEDVLNGLAEIFGIAPVRNYLDLKEKAYLIGGSHSSLGDVAKLKTIFPSLWSDIQAALSSKGLNEEEVIYMLYNQESAPEPERLAGFSKDPFYLGHDIGHSVFDSSDSDWEFKGMLSDFMEKIFSLYISDEESEEESEESEEEFEELPANASAEIIKSNDQESFVQEHLEDFFNVTSEQNDTYGDVFAGAADGTISIDIPNNLYLSKYYYLPPEKRVEAEALGAAIIKRLKDYMNSNQQYGTNGSGALSHLAGYVVLQDI